MFFSCQGDESPSSSLYFTDTVRLMQGKKHNLVEPDIFT